MSLFNKIEIKIINFLFGLFWIYNYVLVWFEDKMKPYGLILNAWPNKKIEPELETWNYIGMVNMNLEKPRLIEQYKCGTEEEFKSWTMDNTAELGDDVLFIRKNNNYRVSKIWNENAWFDEIPNPNNTRFLNIIYFHNLMKEPIKLNLDVSYIRNGNEVLSKTFVFRLLSYNYDPNEFVFDNNYEIKIMDDKVKCHVLTSANYLFFNDRLPTGYEVRSLKSRNKETNYKKIDENVDKLVADVLTTK
jgi:hypothetical protein